MPLPMIVPTTMAAACQGPSARGRSPNAGPLLPGAFDWIASLREISRLHCRAKAQIRTLLISSVTYLKYYLKAHAVEIS